jgi:hypothetical protein
VLVQKEFADNRDTSGMDDKRIFTLKKERTLRYGLFFYRDALSSKTELVFCLSQLINN